MPHSLSFAPGANFIASREKILNHSKIFYENLRVLVEHDDNSLESHFIERSIKTIFNSNVKASPIFSSHKFSDIKFNVGDNNKMSKLKSLLYRVL